MSKNGKKAIAFILYYLGLILTGTFAGFGYAYITEELDKEDN